MEHEVPEMEMIIIKRGHAHEEHPHGGAWKVAFADFMTAMMAFFLVLWIVNSTNKETRSSVARYFNPIRISDTTAARKGLKDPKEADFDASASDDKQKSKSSAGGADVSKQEGGASHVGAGGFDNDGISADGLIDPFLLKDPFLTLDDLAKRDAAPRPVQVELAYEGAQQFRDPFAPPSPVVPPEMKTILKLVQSGSRLAGPEEGRADASGTPDLPELNTRKVEKNPEKQTVDTNEIKADPKDGKGELADVKDLRSQIAQALKSVGLTDGPKLDVRRVDEGILISLTDDLNFGMFKIGSAEPEPAIVRAMAKIGDILRQQKGSFVLRGHTDARAYRTPAYDNWRLSSARAQTAAYMLMRGKLDEKRIERVEGHADRALRNLIDPLAPENRRIEILLRRAT